GTRPSASTDHRADCRAFSATGYCANNRAQGRTDRSPLNGLLRLIVVAHRSFVIYPNSFAARSANGLKYARKPGCSSVSHTYIVKVERHFRTTCDSSAAIHARNIAFDGGAVVLRRRSN